MKVIFYPNSENTKINKTHLFKCDDRIYNKCNALKGIIRKITHLSEMLDHHGRDAPEDVVVGQPVEEAVDGHGHVARLDRAVVLEVER